MKVRIGPPTKTAFNSREVFIIANFTETFAENEMLKTFQKKPYLSGFSVGAGLTQSNP